MKGKYGHKDSKQSIDSFWGEGAPTTKEIKTLQQGARSSGAPFEGIATTTEQAAGA
jgi:hypothetical protein